MQLAPSEIHFIRDYSIHKPDEHLLSYFRNSLLSLKDLPKIQVVERNGAWFALNNSYLHVFLELEKQGKCPRIPVDVVPLSKVPKTVQETMVISATNKCNDWHADARNTTNGGGTVFHLNDKNEQPETSTNYTAVQHTILEISSGMVSCQHATDTKKEHTVINIMPATLHQDDTSQDGMDSSDGPGRITKRGYHKLSDGGGDDCVIPLQDSETEGTSSFSGTDCSDYDGENALDAETESESDEALTCNVCDRSFQSLQKLSQHQQRKRHFGCSICDSIFPTLMTLELHKESLEHWSDDEGIAQGGGGDSDEESDDDDNDINSPTEELERLL